MATKDVKMKLIVDAEDNTSGVLKRLDTKLGDLNKNRLKNLNKSFKKMATVGVAALTGLAVGLNKVVQSAAVAEGAYNKFNTVFAEGSEDMLSFIEELRKTMPTATHEIVRMAADLQDLLVPMGVTREKAQEMSKGFLDVANKIAAFNDVDPTDVLESIKSGLAGSSEPLRRFGVNALESALEARALKDGLLGVGETFKNLDPEVRTQIRSQALLSQIIENSSDAIAGFEDNNNSFIRRQQDLKATFEELSVTIGNVFIPMADDLLKKMKPLIDKFAEWAEANPEQIENYVVMAAKIAGITTAVGLLGMALTSPIGAFILLGLAIGYAVAHWQKYKDGFGVITDFVDNMWAKFFNKQITNINKFIESINGVLKLVAKVTGKKDFNVFKTIPLMEQKEIFAQDNPLSNSQMSFLNSKGFVENEKGELVRQGFSSRENTPAAPEQKTNNINIDLRGAVLTDKNLIDKLSRELGQKLLADLITP